MSEQPRAVSLHINRKTGDMHLHLGYSLVREAEHGRLYVQKLGLYKNKLKHLARELERDYGLKIVSNERQPHDRARIAGRGEVEESRRLGTDVREIRTAILDSLEQSDGGKAFKAALEGRGFVLANGDRRDCFVVIDPAGGQHALNKKLTGLTLAETRERLADLDRSQLPSVEQATTIQAERQAAREAQEREKHGRADGQGRDERPASDPQRGPQPEIKPLGQTAGEIRLAWQTSKTGAQFAQALEDRGLIPVYVSREEAEASWRAAAFAKAIGRQSRALKEGFAVVDQRGNVTRIDQRTTGDLWEEIQKRLGGIDKDRLHSAAEARDIMADRRRAEWISQQRDQRDQARPATAIERAILECRETARLSGADIAQDGESKTVHGPQAFAARLDQAGLAIVRVTEADMGALAELRSEENLAREIARTNNEAYRPHHFAEGLSAGDIAAVTRRGDVYRLNSHRLDIEAIAASLESAGAGRDEALPSLTEARVTFLIERNVDAALRDEAREEAREARIERDGDLETARTIEEAERDMRDVTEASEEMVDGAAAGIGRGVEKVLGAAFDAAANFIAPPPPPSKEQVKVMRQQAEFRADLAAWAAEQAAQANQQDDARRKQRAAEREAEEEARRRDWQDRERERERDH